MRASFAGQISRFRLKPQTIILALLSLVLIGLAAASYQWRIDGDLAWELYVARMVDQHGMVPYRDIYVIDMPGTILVYALIGRIIGYTGDLAARIVDWVCFAGLAALTWLWLRRIGAWVGWAAVVLFGLVYFEAGSAMALQREYLMLLPITGAAILAGGAPRLDDRLRAGLIGLLFGLIATIKPNAAVGLPVLVVALLVEARARAGLDRRRALALIGWAALGAALPVVGMIIALAASGGLMPLVDIVTHYGPLYGQTTYNLQVVSGAARIDYLFSTLVTLNGRQVWLLPAGVGLMALFLPGVAGDAQRRQVALMLALAGCYLIYPALTGQFFIYHWLPFVYFLLALAALCLAPLPDDMDRWLRWLPAAALALTLALRYEMVTLALDTMNTRFVENIKPAPPGYGRVDQIAAFARQNFSPGDTAQPLDWGDGAMTGLLLADFRPANRFVFDAPFYYDAKGDYIQGIRREFIDSLNGDHGPQWVVYISDQPVLNGPGVSYNWPALQRAMDGRYQLRYVGRDTYIYGRSDGVARGVIVYPKPSGRPLQVVLPQPDNLLWVGEGETTTPKTLAARLAEFSANRPLITLDASPLDADPIVLLTLLSRGGYHLDEQAVSDTVAVDFLNMPNCSGKVAKVSATFGDSMSVEGAAASLITVGKARYICVEVDWRAARTVGQFYHIALHLIGPDGKLVAQHDGVPRAGAAPTNIWEQGTAVADRVAIRLPDGLAAGKYQVNVVVYDPGTGARVPVGGGDSLPIAAIPIP